MRGSGVVEREDVKETSTARTGQGDKKEERGKNPRDKEWGGRVYVPF